MQVLVATVDFASRLLPNLLKSTFLFQLAALRQKPIIHGAVLLSIMTWHQALHWSSVYGVSSLDCCKHQGTHSFIFRLRKFIIDAFRCYLTLKHFFGLLTKLLQDEPDNRTEQHRVWSYLPCPLSATSGFLFNISRFYRGVPRKNLS